jgi:hypothetical protein
MKYSSYFGGLPKYTWSVISVGNGTKGVGHKDSFYYDGIGFAECSGKMTLVSRNTFRHKYLNPEWWAKNTYRRKDMTHKKANRSDVYYVHDVKRVSNIIDVINKNIEFSEWATKNKIAFWEQSPILLDDVFDELIAKINKKYKMNIQRDKTKPSYQSYIQLVTCNPKETLILTWQNSH